MPRPNKQRFFSRFTQVAAWVCALAVTVAPLPASAQAPAPIAIGVSVPSEPLRVNPGDSASLGVRITNPGTEALSVTVAQRALNLADDGRVELLESPDPRWAPQVRLPKESLTVAPQGMSTFDIGITVPPDTAPDIYLIGFLVSPAPERPNQGIRVVAAAGNYFALDVLGPRTRNLTAQLTGPRFSWDRELESTIRVSNTGPASLYFWGEHGSTRLPQMFLPSGRTRDVGITEKSTLGLGYRTMKVRLFYNLTDAEVTQVDLSRRVWFVHPAYPVGLVAVALIGLGILLIRRRRAASWSHLAGPGA